MTINNFKYFPFSIKFNNPFKTSSRTITGRNGFIISLTDELGNFSFGECSPLPGSSTESIEDAEKILKGLQYQMIGFRVEENLTALADFLSEFHLVPSLQFALEQAIIGLFCNRNKNFIKDTFVTERTEFEVNAVFGFGEEGNILDRINEKFKKGYNTFKIKIGRDDFELDYKFIQSVHTKFGSSIKIRLDANRKWTFENAKSYLEQLSLFGIEYIEEPCNDLHCNLQLAQNSIIPIALDESLSSFEDAYKVMNESNINFIILKPMIYGGIISSLKIIQEAGKRNINVIISSAFESAVGRSALALLATSINHAFAHGLDTSEYFKHDICKSFYEVRNGKIFYESKNYPPQFDLVFL